MSKIITVTEYAKLEGIKRDAVYKRMLRSGLPNGAVVIKVAGRNFIQLP